MTLSSRRAAWALAVLAALAVASAIAMWPSIRLLPHERTGPRESVREPDPGVQTDEPERDWQPSIAVGRGEEVSLEEGRPVRAQPVPISPPGPNEGQPGEARPGGGQAGDSRDGAAAGGPALGSHRPGTAASASGAPGGKTLPTLEEVCRKLLECKGTDCPKPPVLCLPWARKKGRR